MKKGVSEQKAYHHEHKDHYWGTVTLRNQQAGVTSKYSWAYELTRNDKLVSEKFSLEYGSTDGFLRRVYAYPILKKQKPLTLKQEINVSQQNPISVEEITDEIVEELRKSLPEPVKEGLERLIKGFQAERLE